MATKNILTTQVISDKSTGKQIPIKAYLANFVKTTEVSNGCLDYIPTRFNAGVRMEFLARAKTIRIMGLVKTKLKYATDLKAEADAKGARFAPAAKLPEFYTIGEIAPFLMQNRTILDLFDETLTAQYVATITFDYFQGLKEVKRQD